MGPIGPVELPAYKDENERRNQLQRERRATPEAKAKEARATKISRYKKLGNTRSAYPVVFEGGEVCHCNTCSQAERYEQVKKALAL